MLVGPGAVHAHQAVEALADHVVVENLVAIASVKENAEVEVLVAEGIGPAEGEQRQRAADVGTVVLVDFAVLVHILELEVAGPYGCCRIKHAVGRIFFCTGAVLDIVEVLIDTYDFITVETIKRLPEFGNGNDIAPLAVTDELRVCSAVESHELVLVEGNLEVAVPSEVLGRYRMSVEGDFQTLVLDGAIVTARCRERRRGVALCSHIGRKGKTHEHIGRNLLVCIHHEVHLPAEETQIETDVGLALLLPVDTGVGNPGGTFTGAECGRHGAHGCLPCAASDVGVTCLAPAETDFTVVDSDTFEEISQALLVGEAPASCEGMESRPTVIGAEVGAAVVTEGIGEEIAVVVAVGLTGEEGRHCGMAISLIHGGSALALADIDYIIAGEACARTAEISPSGLPALLTGHCGEVVLAYGVVVCNVVLQLPE